MPTPPSQKGISAAARREAAARDLGEALAGAIDSADHAGTIQAISTLQAANHPRALMALLAALWPRRELREERKLFVVFGHTLTWKPVSRRVPPAIRAAAETALDGALRDLPASRLAELDLQFRGVSRWTWTIVAGPKDARQCLDAPKPEEIAAGPSRTAQLCLLSCHADGHLREDAVAALAPLTEPMAFRFLLLRAADWVPQVAARAVGAVEARLAEPLPVPVMLDALPLLPRLGMSSRPAAKALYAHLSAFMTAPEQTSLLVAAVRSPERHISRVAAGLADRAPREDIARAAAGSRDAPTRARALTWELSFRKTEPALAADLRNVLLKDSSAGLRSKALRAHVETDGPVKTLHAALLDPAPAVREIARYHLRPSFGKNDCAVYYRQILTGNERPAVRAAAAAVAGLGETGDATDVPLLREQLSGSPFPARAALRALVKLDPEASNDILIKTLGDPRRSLQREALRLLGPRLAEQDAETLRLFWAQSACDKRLLALALLRLPPWTALKLLLEGASGAPEAAAEALARWKPEERRLYKPIAPAAESARELRGLLIKAAPLLDRQTSEKIDEALKTWAKV